MDPGSSASDQTPRPRAQADNGVTIAEVDVRKRRGISLVWTIPIVAAIVAGYIAVTTYLNQGPVITISFETGDGLEAGKTKVKYKDVDIGVVQSVKISDDLQRVMATAEMNKGTSHFLTSDARFWIVRPRIGAGGVSGLGTLLSGAYVEVDPGAAKGSAERDFTGLEVPPLIHSNVPGRTYTLMAPSLGSISRGASIYYRGIDVGQILGYELAKDDKSLIIHIFVRDAVRQAGADRQPLLERERPQPDHRRQRRLRPHGLRAVAARRWRGVRHADPSRDGQGRGGETPRSSSSTAARRWTRMRTPSECPSWCASRGRSAASRSARRWSSAGSRSARSATSGWNTTPRRTP